ncbi:MAG: hypothetical protein BGP16_00980 [Sphingobium sp. 66-54]|nr:MAG: hypothetical protein BGP16_00980 [Sphingobium sp. 66-54]
MKAPILKASEWEQVEAHLATMKRPAHYRLLVLLVRKLGLRPKELAALDRSWFRSDELRIPIGYSKRGSGRSLPVDNEILTALEDHMGDRTGLVFVNRMGLGFTPGLLSESVRRLFREAGVQGSAYSGRRGMATRLVDEGANILVVQKALGHKHASTTMSYVEVTDSMLRRALFA